MAGLRARAAFMARGVATYSRNTRHWLRNRRCTRAARRELAERGDLVAAEALWTLNRLAKTCNRRAQIYALKNVLVRVFHGRHPTTVHLHRQELPCWGDRTYGCGPDCWRCDGTGVYRSIRLYLFRITIGGRRYSWHQPERLVDWPVELAGEEGDWHERGALGAEAAGSDEVERLLALLRVYLVEVAGEELPGEAVPTNATLGEALLGDWLHLRWRVEPALRAATARVRGLVARPMWRERPLKIERAEPGWYGWDTTTAGSGSRTGGQIR